MTSEDAPRLPSGLQPAGRAFWRKITSTYTLSLGELALLARVCRTVDLLSRIDRELAAGDLLVPGSTGQVRQNPLLEAKSSQERVLELLVRGLALPFEFEKTGRRRTPSQALKAKEASSGEGDRARGRDPGAPRQIHRR